MKSCCDSNTNEKQLIGRCGFGVLVIIEDVLPWRMAADYVVVALLGGYCQGGLQTAQYFTQQDFFNSK
jgi:hypothetical protein